MTMKKSLLLMLFGGIFAAMIAVTANASLDRSVFPVGPQLMSASWFPATLADAYFGFLMFYVLVAYKETGMWRKVFWLYSS